MSGPFTEEEKKIHFYSSCQGTEGQPWAFAHLHTFRQPLLLFEYMQIAQELDYNKLAAFHCFSFSLIEMKVLFLKSSGLTQTKAATVCVEIKKVNHRKKLKHNRNYTKIECVCVCVFESFDCSPMLDCTGFRASTLPA